MNDEKLSRVDTGRIVDHEAEWQRHVVDAHKATRRAGQTDSGVIDHKTTWRGEVYARNPKATRQVQRARRAPLVVFLSLLIPGGAS